MDTKTSYQASLAEKLDPRINLTDLTNSNDQVRSQQEGSGTNQSENVVLLDPDSSMSPEEKVFSIDHVMESIFHKLDKTNLLNSRFVSQRWAYFATKALQNIVTISFYSSSRLIFCGDSDLILFETKKRRPVQELVDLMNNSSTVEFLCTSFYFRNNSYSLDITYDIVTPALEPFFSSTHASRLEKLQLEGFFPSQVLSHLICTRALNLKHLELKEVEFDAGLKDSAENADADVANLMDCKTLARPPEKVVFKNLKVFTCDNQMSDNIIHQILESSPNLSEVFLHHQNLHCLVKPTNRLHLLKTLVIGEDALASLELIANNLENNLVAVQTIRFSGYDEYLKTPSQSFVDTMKTILKHCSGTSTKLAWFNFLENFEIPSICLYFNKAPQDLIKCLQDIFPNPDARS